ncbi:predicted protein [Streptomyces lividans TK24]|uniref:Uncharacterized protein n=1 Tax=Streptomyces lividans 1326 TaxID=1200984 RepID=A0A7U9E3E9_STRLI|nr:predicted protein [Streptomyces lividans TK24]EOY52118.1 hypothetical protein SLI_7414 [Streptomyces lividans 1326]
MPTPRLGEHGPVQRAHADGKSVRGPRDAPPPSGARTRPSSPGSPRPAPR